MIRSALMNVAIAAAYILWTGERSLAATLIGFGAGYIAISLYERSMRRVNYLVRVGRVIRFVIYFLVVLIKANFQIAWEILTPGLGQRPRILRYSVAGMTDLEITTFANCITLTPGTLVVDVSPGKEWVYVHCMYASDPAEPLAELADLERRIRRGLFS